MALFTDGFPATLDYVRKFESSLDRVAAEERIDLEVKLALAAEDVSEEIIEFLTWQGDPPTRAERTRLGVTDVVVTTPVRRWHAMRSLADVYRDAFNAQLNDRYKGKWTEYERLANEAGQRARSVGIGLVNQPLPRPIAPKQLQIGGEVTRNEYSVAIAWVNGSGEESITSDVALMQLGVGDQVVPVGGAPEFAIGWSLYLGIESSALMRQNEGAINLAEPRYFEDGVLRPGSAPAGGQRPDRYVVECRRILRG